MPSGPVSAGTKISGDMISTGKIHSTNWDGTQGSQLDLNAGTIKLGGDTSPKFAVDREGSLTASAGTIGGLTIGDDFIKQGTTYRFSSSTDAGDPAGFISSSKFKVSPDGTITGSNVLFESG